MTSSTTHQIPDLSDHKRKVFFEHLSPTTTTDSLKEYLSGFQIERCIVPSKEGRSQGYGTVIFRKESNVDNLMLNRPHRIDGQRVELYRSVPDQGSLKEKKGIKNLIVSGIQNGSITKTDLKQYFSVFGTINDIDMTYNENSCCIAFEDYDAVDKALLDRPHTIRNIEVHITKGNRNGQRETTTWSRNIQTPYSNNNNVLQKKPILKQVQTNPQISAVNIPRKIYCIHIKNLPSNANAEILSKKFSWPIDNMVMITSSDDQSLPIECWLKDIDERQKAENFAQRWNGQIILGLKIECTAEEDQRELCKEFRIGKCPKEGDDCDWQHIMCTANGKCSIDCPYGHKEGTKTGYINKWSNEAYRIKITGFQKELTSEMLARVLREKNCCVNRNQDRIGYITHLRTMKYARRLMAKWHNKVVDGQKLECQIELDTGSSMSKSLVRSRSMSQLIEKENDSCRSDFSRQQSNASTKSDRDTSAVREDNDSSITIIDDQDFNNEGRIFDRYVEDIIKQKVTDAKRKTRSVEIVSLSIHPKSQTSNEISEDGRKMSVLRKKTDYGSFAFLVEYKNIDKEIYNRELNALKLLKGVKGVVQLIELENSSNNNDQQLTSNGALSLVTEHPRGYSLKEFVNEIHRGGFGVLEAIKLVQNLLIIVKQVHSRGVLHQNLEPENIMIEWDSKQTSTDQARLILINFSQAYIKSERNNQIIQSTAQYWYKAPQLNVESLKHSSTIDASSICAILLWLLANTDFRHGSDLLPHQHENTSDKLDNKIAQAVRNANVKRKQLLEETQLKTYLIDTFDIGFGYPQHQPWTISDLECRLESIHELLSPRNPKLDTTDAVFKDLISTSNIVAPVSSVTTDANQDIFQKASIAFQQAKTNFSKAMNDQYSWSDGGCTWLDSTQISIHERRHDDILTYFSWKANQTSRCSVIITCLAAVDDNENIITLSIGNTVNGKMSRIPIGRYGKNQNYINQFQDAFISELKNLIISICKKRRTIKQ